MARHVFSFLSLLIIIYLHEKYKSLKAWTSVSRKCSSAFPEIAHQGRKREKFFFSLPVQVFSFFPAWPVSQFSFQAPFLMVVLFKLYKYINFLLKAYLAGCSSGTHFTTGRVCVCGWVGTSRATGASAGRCCCIRNT